VLLTEERGEGWDGPLTRRGGERGPRGFFFEGKGDHVILGSEGKKGRERGRCRVPCRRMREESGVGREKGVAAYLSFLLLGSG